MLNLLIHYAAENFAEQSLSIFFFFFFFFGGGGGGGGGGGLVTHLV